MNPRERPRREPGYRLEMVDDELLLFHPATTRIVYCNATAGLIWRLCDGERTVGEIVALLTEAYPEAAETLAADVERALEQLCACRAITLA
ncbi:MAG: PqqD family protein [Anaerolineales bacterium]